MAGQGPGEGTRKRCCKQTISATTAGKEHNGNASTEKISTIMQKTVSNDPTKNKSCSRLAVLSLGHDPVRKLLPALSVWIGGTKEVGT